jgi:hypothetical protein
MCVQDASLETSRLPLFLVFQCKNGCVLPATNFLLLELHVVSNGRSDVGIVQANSHSSLGSGHCVELVFGV